jgi:hypothetical protein
MIYLKGYPPIKANNTTIENNMAVVEKLAGKIKINTRKTGNQSRKNDFLKVTS